MADGGPSLGVDAVVDLLVRRTLAKGCGRVEIRFTRVDGAFAGASAGGAAAGVLWVDSLDDCDGAAELADEVPSALADVCRRSWGLFGAATHCVSTAAGADAEWRIREFEWGANGAAGAAAVRDDRAPNAARRPGTRLGFAIPAAAENDDDARLLERYMVRFELARSSMRLRIIGALGDVKSSRRALKDRKQHGKKNSDDQRSTEHLVRRYAAALDAAAHGDDGYADDGAEPRALLYASRRSGSTQVSVARVDRRLPAPPGDAPPSAGSLEVVRVVGGAPFLDGPSPNACSLM